MFTYASIDFYWCAHLLWEDLRTSVHVRECACLQACVHVCVCVCDGNKCGEREVAEESDGSSTCCRLSLQGRTLLQPTKKGQLRVIGSLVLGGELPPSHAFKWESSTEGKEKRLESKVGGVLNNENVVCVKEAGRGEGRQEKKTQAKNGAIRNKRRKHSWKRNELFFFCFCLEKLQWLQAAVDSKFFGFCVSTSHPVWHGLMSGSICNMQKTGWLNSYSHPLFPVLPVELSG